MPARKGWYSRGYIPHFNAGSTPQFITWRLADSLPAHVIEQIQSEIAELDEAEQKKARYKRIESYLDAGHGEALLSRPLAAKAVEDSLFYDASVHYDLHAWVIMPTHVHVLLTPSEDTTLGQIMRRIKTASAMAVNRSLGRKGTLWQPDYFDRFIRDPDHFDRVKKYIEWNAYKAGLTSDPKHFRWSSANERSLQLLQDDLARKFRGPELP